MVKFREGSFKATNLQQASAFGVYIDSLKKYYKGNKRVYFLRAMWKLYNNPAFDFKVFTQKLKYLSVRMVDCPSVKDYLRLIEELYNFKHRGKRVRLY